MKQLILLALSTSLLAGCSTDADLASRNLSKAAEQFEVMRRVVFYNGITDTYILSIEGLCSVEVLSNYSEVTCKTDDGFKKHFLRESDNTTMFVEHMQAKDVSTSRYKVIFKPSSIVPDVEVK